MPEEQLSLLYGQTELDSGWLIFRDKYMECLEVFKDEAKASMLPFGTLTLRRQQFELPSIPSNIH
eukprot:4362880-Ditylum_brightwellii.AAC.1